MKTGAALYLVGLALSARPLLAAPVGSPGSSRNPAHALMKRFWVLNCTSGLTPNCVNAWNTWCDGPWVTTDDNWCYNNCECYWEYQCPALGGCKAPTQPGGETGEGNGDERKGVETAEPTKTPETV